MRFHGGRHWPLILCFACLVRAKGIGFGVMEDFGGGVTEYSWGYLAYCALNIYPASGPPFHMTPMSPSTSAEKAPRPPFLPLQTCLSLRASTHDAARTNHTW